MVYPVLEQVSEDDLILVFLLQRKKKIRKSHLEGERFILNFFHQIQAIVIFFQILGES